MLYEIILFLIFVSIVVTLVLIYAFAYSPKSSTKMVMMYQIYTSSVTLSLKKSICKTVYKDYNVLLEMGVRLNQAILSNNYKDMSWFTRGIPNSFSMDTQHLVNQILYAGRCSVISLAQSGWLKAILYFPEIDTLGVFVFPFNFDPTNMIQGKSIVEMVPVDQSIITIPSNVEYNKAINRMNLETSNTPPKLLGISAMRINDILEGEQELLQKCMDTKVDPPMLYTLDADVTNILQSIQPKMYSLYIDSSYMFLPGFNMYSNFNITNRIIVGTLPTPGSVYANVPNANVPNSNSNEYLLCKTESGQMLYPKFPETFDCDIVHHYISGPINIVLGKIEDRFVLVPFGVGVGKVNTYYNVALATPPYDEVVHYIPKRFGRINHIHLTYPPTNIPKRILKRTITTTMDLFQNKEYMYLISDEPLNGH